MSFKVQLFPEGHKNVHNRPDGFEIYLVKVKTIRILSVLWSSQKRWTRKMGRKIQKFTTSCQIFTMIHPRFLNPEDFIHQDILDFEKCILNATLWIFWPHLTLPYSALLWKWAKMEAAMWLQLKTFGNWPEFLLISWSGNRDGHQLGLKSFRPQANSKGFRFCYVGGQH